MADRFAVRRSLPRPLPRLEPVADRLLGQARLGEVVAQQLRLRLGGLRELRFQHLADPPVELLPLALDQRVVQRVFEQGVLEDVGAARRPALRVQDLRLHQLGQLRLERRLVHGRDGGEQLVAELAAEDRGELGQLPVALHPVQAGHHQVLERGGDLVPEQGLGRVPPVPRLVQHARFLHHLREFFDEQRHAAGPVVDLLDHRFRQRAPRLLPHQVADLAPRQAVQGQAGLVGDGGPRRLELGAEGEQGQDRSCRPSARNCPRNSRVDASTQCRSSTTNRTGLRAARTCSHSSMSRNVSSLCRAGDSESGGNRSGVGRDRSDAHSGTVSGRARSYCSRRRSSRSNRACGGSSGRSRGPARRSRWPGTAPCSGSAASSATR